mmetsp:Transcript_10828/g.17131  ORF Transcript_10828/g.17131 Transcript_10828/m.17131 type:complete len:240 (+) Transcript_10828:510-1229(+)
MHAHTILGPDFRRSILERDAIGFDFLLQPHGVFDHASANVKHERFASSERRRQFADGVACLRQKHLLYPLLVVLLLLTVIIGAGKWVKVPHLPVLIHYFLSLSVHFPLLALFMVCAVAVVENVKRARLVHLRQKGLLARWCHNTIGTLAGRRPVVLVQALAAHDVVADMVGGNQRGRLQSLLVRNLVNVALFWRLRDHVKMLLAQQLLIKGTVKGARKPCIFHLLQRAFDAMVVKLLLR